MWNFIDLPVGQAKPEHNLPEAIAARAKSTDREQTDCEAMILLHDFVTDFVTVILSPSEGLSKMALWIVKIYLGSPFSANRRCSRSVCRGQLSWTHCSLPQASVYFKPCNQLVMNLHKLHNLSRDSQTKSTQTTW